MSLPSSFVSYTFKRVYAQDVSSERAEIRKDGPHGHSRMTHWKKQGSVQMQADFDVEIDVQKIAEQLARKAQRNRTGKAGAMGGLIKVKWRNTKELSRDVKDVPLPNGWYEVGL